MIDPNERQLRWIVIEEYLLRGTHLSGMAKHKDSAKTALMNTLCNMFSLLKSPFNQELFWEMALS